MNHTNSNCWEKWRFPVDKSKRCGVSRCSFPLVSRRHAPVVSTLAQRCQKDWNVLVVFQIYNTTSVSAYNHMSLNKTSLELFSPLKPTWGKWQPWSLCVPADHIRYLKQDGKNRVHLLRHSSPLKTTLELGKNSTHFWPHSFHVF